MPNNGGDFSTHHTLQPTCMNHTCSTPARHTASHALLGTPANQRAAASTWGRDLLLGWFLFPANLEVKLLHVCTTHITFDRLMCVWIVERKNRICEVPPHAVRSSIAPLPTPRLPAREGGEKEGKKEFSTVSPSMPVMNTPSYSTSATPFQFLRQPVTSLDRSNIHRKTTLSLS